MNKKKKNTRLTYMVLALLCFGGIGSLIASSLSENSVYFLNIGELLAMEVTQAPSNARIFGSVAEGYQRSTESTEIRFTLLDKFDKSQSMDVVYSGAIPDAFKVNAEVIAEGKIVYTDGKAVMHATTIMAKCPSKYAEKSRQIDEELAKKQQEEQVKQYT